MSLNDITLVNGNYSRQENSQYIRSIQMYIWLGTYASVAGRAPDFLVTLKRGWGWLIAEGQKDRDDH